MYTRFLVTLLWALVAYVYGQKFEGEDCQMRDGSAGVCRSLEDCQTERDAITIKQERPVVCSFKGKIAIVCCQEGTKSEAKCSEYSSAVYSNKEVQTLLSESYTISVSSCAQSSRELIVGGMEAFPKEFPHMAALGYGDEGDKRWLCGGTLISDRYVLTAAHCQLNREMGKVRWALLGDLNYLRTDDDSMPLLTEVDKIIPHPDYNASSYYYDIALLKLKEIVVFNPYVRPACLNTLNNLTAFGTSVIATGWGYTAYNGDVSPSLMKVGLKIDLPSKCNSAFKTLHSRLIHGFDETTMICAGDPVGIGNDTWRDTCGGDSGAPLQTILKTPYCMYSIVGLTSFGNTACGISPSPAVYTRVAYFVPWIETVVWTN